MKCIKEKCEAFMQHDFNVSCFKCGFDSLDRSWKKDGEPICIIEHEMNMEQSRLDSLRTVCEIIKSRQ